MQLMESTILKMARRNNIFMICVFTIMVTVMVTMIMLSTTVAPQTEDIWLARLWQLTVYTF